MAATIFGNASIFLMPSVAAKKPCIVRRRFLLQDLVLELLLGLMCHGDEPKIRTAGRSFWMGAFALAFWVPLNHQAEGSDSALELRG